MYSKLRISLPAFLFSAIFSAVPQNLSAAENLVENLNSTCLATELKGCTITASGYIQIIDGPLIAYQIQNGYTEDTGTGAGVVIFENTKEKWNLLAQDFLGAQYALPRLTEGEQILLHVPGITAGTGAYNADILLEYTKASDAKEANWQKVDLETWQQNIEDFLPKNLGVWKGVAFDFGIWSGSDYIARTPLWKNDDANCCATGGQAIIHFIIEDYVLKTSKVDYLPPN